MISLYEASRPDALVVAPAFEGRRGNPALFSASLKDELLQASGDAGGRGIIQRLEKESPQRIVFLHLPNDDIFLDIDTEKITNSCFVNSQKPHTSSEGVYSW